MGGLPFYIIAAEVSPWQGQLQTVIDGLMTNLGAVAGILGVCAVIGKYYVDSRKNSLDSLTTLRDAEKSISDRFVAENSRILEQNDALHIKARKYDIIVDLANRQEATRFLISEADTIYNNTFRA